MLKDTIRGDVDDIFMNIDEFAEDATYSQDGANYSVRVIVGENDIDHDADISVLSVATIYMSDSYGIRPKPHDIINDKWEVWERKFQDGLWILTCYEKERVKP